MRRASRRAWRRARRSSICSRTLPFPPGRIAWILRRSNTARIWAKTARTKPSWMASWQLQRLGPNALTLDFCCYRTGEGPYSEPLPIIAVQQILCARQYRGPFWMRQVFNVEAASETGVARRRESGRAGDFAQRQGGRRQAGRLLPRPLIRETGHLRASQIGRQYTWNCGGSSPPCERESSSLAGLFQNLIGTELESSYIVGEFAVHGKETAERPGWVRLQPEFRIGAEPSGPASGRDLIGQGYPFFAGVMRASRRLTLARPGRG